MWNNKCVLVQNYKCVRMDVYLSFFKKKRYMLLSVYKWNLEQKIISGINECSRLLRLFFTLCQFQLKLFCF